MTRPCEKPAERKDNDVLDTLRIPGEEELLSAKAGQTVVLTGVNTTLAAVLACRAARAGRRTLLVAENDPGRRSSIPSRRGDRPDPGSRKPGKQLATA